MQEAEPYPSVVRATVTNDRFEPTLLRKRLWSGVRWNAGSQIVAQVSRTVTTLILAHLLLPAEFGLAGMVLVFVGLTQLLTDIGLTGSIVQFENLTDTDRSTAFWSGIIMGAVCLGAAFVVAPYVASFYGEPQVRWMFVLISTGVLIGALANTQAALLVRRMEFRALELRNMIAMGLSGAAGIAAALAGLGAWSLIIQATVASITSAAAVWLMSPWKPSLAFSVASLRRMGTFSVNIFLSRFMTYGDRNADNLIVGRFLGASALGIYAIGYSVILIPFERLIAPVIRILTPAFASLQHDIERSKALWLLGSRLVSSVMFPTMVGVIIGAPDFVSLVLGHRWERATPIIQILAWVALVQSLGYANSAIYQSRFRSGLLLRLTAFAFVVDLAAFVVGLHWGVYGVAAGYAIANTVLVVPLGLFYASRLLETRPVELLRNLRGAAEGTVVMGAALVGLRLVLPGNGVGPGIRCLVLVAAGVGVYALTCLWRDPSLQADLRAWRRGKALVEAPAETTA